MALSACVKENIALTVIEALVSSISPQDVSSTNIDDPFFQMLCNVCSNADFIDKKHLTDASWLQGLNTTLGQSFFEKIAHHLSNGEKREYTSKRSGVLKITQSQADSINHIITALSNSTYTPNMERENKLVFERGDNTSLVDSIGFSADVFYETDDSVIAIELKSVKPNSGEMRGEKEKILHGKAALSRLFPRKSIHFFLGFPFDPTVDSSKEAVSGFDKQRFMASAINLSKFFDPKELLLASELWDFLSGEKNTMQSILDIINIIATPQFMEKYQFLQDNSKRCCPEYKALLDSWGLYSEVFLIENYSKLKAQACGRFERVLNQRMFTDDTGVYNLPRYGEMSGLLSKA